MRAFAEWLSGTGPSVAIQSTFWFIRLLQATHLLTAGVVTASGVLLALRVLGRHRADQPFDAVFYPGGHGPLWDLAEDRDSIALIESTYAAGKPVAAVCHAPGVLQHARDAYGLPLVQGKAVTGFANSEEAAVGLTDVVPFLVEDMLTAHGGLYEKGDDWAAHVVTDRNLITGQNPASSKPAAEALLRLLETDSSAVSESTPEHGR